MARQMDFKPVDLFSKVQNTTDVPSETNKAQDHPLDADGGLNWRQGIFADQTKEAGSVTRTPDDPTSGIDIKSIITIGIALLVLMVIIKVSK
jgi:hypothetical protein